MKQADKDSHPDLEPQGQSAELEIVEPDALASIQRAEIDMAVSTAKKWPRSIKQFMEDAKSMISLDVDTAEACNYKLKRKEASGGVKIIEGPSIRLMEICASSFQNVRYGSRIISMEGSFVTCQGVASDMQRNVHCTVEVQRRITYRDGRRYGDDLVGLTANAGGSIARRNALKGIIPVAYINALADFAKKIAIGDIKSLPERRQRAVEYFTKTLGIDITRVLAYCEKPSIQDLTLDDVEDLQGLKTSLKEGDIKLEEAFADTSKVEKPKISESPVTYAAGQGAQEPKPADKPPEEKKLVDKLPELLALMAKDSVAEPVLLEYLRALTPPAIDETLGSLQQVNEISPSAIASCITGWKIIKSKLSGAKP